MKGEHLSGVKYKKGAICLVRIPPSDSPGDIELHSFNNKLVIIRDTKSSYGYNAYLINNKRLIYAFKHEELTLIKVNKLLKLFYL